MKIFISTLLVAWMLAISAMTMPSEAQAFNALADCVDGAEEACHMRSDFGVAEATKHLGESNLIYWIDGNVLRIAVRTVQGAPYLCCTFGGDMERLGEDGKGVIWGQQYRLPHIKESFLRLLVSADGKTSRAPEYDGPSGPKLPMPVKALKGRIETREILSAELGEARKVSFYIPFVAPPAEGYPVVYMADGQDITVFAQITEALIHKGVIQPVLIVGIWAGEGGPYADYPFDKRGREYLPGASVTVYEGHERFVLNEVMLVAEHDFHAARRFERRITFGVSNGAAWALSFATRHGDLFANAAGFGVAARPDGFDFQTARSLHLFIGTGEYDPFRVQTRSVNDKARSAGLRTEFFSLYAGHDQAMWTYGFTETLKAIFPAK